MIPSAHLLPDISLDAICLRLVPEHSQATEAEQYALKRQRHLVHLALLLSQEDPARLVEAALSSNQPNIRKKVQELIETLDAFLLENPALKTN